MFCYAQIVKLACQEIGFTDRPARVVRLGSWNPWKGKDFVDSFGSTKIGV